MFYHFCLLCCNSHVIKSNKKICFIITTHKIDVITFTSFKRLKIDNMYLAKLLISSRDVSINLQKSIENKKSSK